MGYKEMGPRAMEFYFSKTGAHFTVLYVQELPPINKPFFIWSDHFNIILSHKQTVFFFPKNILSVVVAQSGCCILFLFARIYAGYSPSACGGRLIQYYFTVWILNAARALLWPYDGDKGAIPRRGGWGKGWEKDRAIVCSLVL